MSLGCTECGELSGRSYCDRVECPAARALPAAPRLRHKKRGTTYRVEGAALLQSDQAIGDNVSLVVYRCEQTGELWARPLDEVVDGRFEQLDDLSGSGHPLDDAFRDALVVGLENDPQADDVLRIARPYIQRAFDELAREVERWRIRAHSERQIAIALESRPPARPLEDPPTIAEIRAERERSGEGLEACRRRIVRQRLESMIWRARDVDDLRATLRTMLDHVDPPK